ncbi:MAG: HAD-IIIA family hydrolase, partial [Arenicella sp.]|nr:HAD-IIIA family hydrolase [Arenicella sp.]
LLSADMLGKIHVRMIDYVQQHGGRIQGVMFCPHRPEDDCECRKPKTGLYEELAQRLNISFDGVYSVGDSMRDLIAARDAGAIPVLVKTGNGRKSLKELAALGDNEFVDLLVFDNLTKFTAALLDDAI